MVSGTVLKRAGWLAAVTALVAFTGCRDFEQAFETCVAKGNCIPDEPDSGTQSDSGTPTDEDAGDDGGTLPGNDAGMDGGQTPPDAGDAGMDGGPTPPDAGDAGMDGGPETPDASTLDSGVVVADAGDTKDVDAGFACGSSMCLRDQYTLDEPYEFQGLWGSDPDDIFLAAQARSGTQAPSQVVHFKDGQFSTSLVDLPDLQRLRLQGPRAFAALAGPDDRNLYAATSFEVLRWMPGNWWQSELRVPSLHGQTPAVQDIWVSADGSDVWVTLKTDYVLRKHGGQWSIVSLPVERGFSALQIEGFGTPPTDLWITGTWPQGSSAGTSAYHYLLQED